MNHVRLAKLVALALFVAFGLSALLADNFVTRRTYARSTGPDPGHTRAPGEDPEGCRVCHLVEDGVPTGLVTIGAPQSYVPGQTYQMSVNVTNADPSRRRWGFQLTAIDDDGNRAGTLAPLDATTQVMTGQLGSPARQYVSHTSSSTFQGQQNGAAWTFNWTAPQTDVGVVTFYAAGNQANNDENSSGDSINFTFVAIQAAAQTGDFAVTVTPSSQVILPGGTGSYTVTVTPANGFTGTVDLEMTFESIMPGLQFNFSPASVQITDAAARTSTLTFSPNSHLPLGSYNLTVAAASGALRRTAPFTLVTGPTLVDPGVQASIVLSGLDQPTAMAFLSETDFIVLEKATGRVKYFIPGAPGAGAATTVLDLAVNSNSERGLLGVALHPLFPINPRVYLYWTESTTGADTANADETPLLGNRVDSFIWNGASLTHDRNLIRLRALQQDAGQPSRGNHDGGVLRFGPDGKLYVVVGDLGRRGLMQNLRFGPSASPDGPLVADDQLGGPEPDDEHLSGVVLRLNDDGTTPADNPFFNVQTNLTGEAAANVKKVFAYGVRNSFGMDFDPLTGFLWTQENGDDSFDEINRVTAGFNGGWIQLMGPSSRVAEFKQIETARSGGLQQLRWPPERIADTPAAALARLFVLPGSQYREPEFSWKFAIAPAAIGFVRGGALGPATRGTLLVGASRPTLYGGYLFRVPLDAERRGVLAAHPSIADKVADNLDKFEATESAPFDFGRDFGVVTDIKSLLRTVYVVSLSHGAIYALGPKPNSLQFSSATFAAQEDATSATVTVTRTGDTSGTVSVDYRTLDSNLAVPCAERASAGRAFPRCDYASTAGTLTFAPGQTAQTFNVPLVDDAHAEDTEGFTVQLSDYSGVANTSILQARVNITDNDAAGAQNPLDNHAFFVRMHYLDFLSREPEPTGQQAWLDVLNNCPNAFNTDPASPSAQCDRVTVSSSFFRSTEFYNKGYFVYRFYRASLGRRPAYAEIADDMARVTGATEAEVTARRAAFATEWLARPEVAARYPATLAPEAFVDLLLQTAGVALATPDPVSGATRDSLVNELRLGNRSRAEVLRTVVESREVDAKEFNGAFVAMQYFGYLRRDPEEPGYTNWLNYLNANPTDFRTMVNGFLYSQEYRLRFGSVD